MQTLRLSVKHIVVPLTLLSCLQPLHCLDEAIFILSET